MNSACDSVSEESFNTKEHDRLSGDVQIEPSGKWNVAYTFQSTLLVFLLVRARIVSEKLMLSTSEIVE
jgi:hypothetical protein